MLERTAREFYSGNSVRVGAPSRGGWVLSNLRRPGRPRGHWVRCTRAPAEINQLRYLPPAFGDLCWGVHYVEEDYVEKY